MNALRRFIWPEPYLSIFLPTEDANDALRKIEAFMVDEGLRVSPQSNEVTFKGKLTSPLLSLAWLGKVTGKVFVKQGGLELQLKGSTAELTSFFFRFLLFPVMFLFMLLKHGSFEKNIIIVGVIFCLIFSAITYPFESLKYFWLKKALEKKLNSVLK